MARASATAPAAVAPVIPGYVVAGTIWAGLALVLAVFAVLFALEASTYFLREPAITPYVRAYVNQRPALTLLGAVVLVAGASAALTHFWIDR